MIKFQQAGGLEHFYAYNKARAKRFGFSEKPEAWSMFVIVRNAIRADSFDQFEIFMDEFKSTNMIKEIQLGRAISIAKFYLQYKKYKQAIKLYKTLAEQNSANANIQNKLGDIYLTLDDRKTAKIYFKKAVELAEISKDKKLNEYKNKLNSL